MVKGFLLLELTLSLAVIGIATPPLYLAATHILRTAKTLTQVHSDLVTAHTLFESEQRIHPQLTLSPEGSFELWTFRLRSGATIQTLTASH